MMILLGDREHIAGWCFEGWIPSTRLAKLLIDLSTKLGMPTGVPMVYGGEAAVRVELPNVIGTVYKFKKGANLEERIRIIVISPRKIPIYEIGLFLKTELDMFLLGKGNFSY